MANEALSKELIIKIWDSVAGTYNTVARLTGYSFEVNKETVEITNFDSGSWKEFLVDLKDWSVSDDGVVIRTAESGKETYEDMLTSIIGTDTVLIIQMINPLAYTDATDGVTYSHEIGNAFLTSMPMTGSVGDKQTYSMTLMGSGTLTHVVAKFDTEAEAFAGRDTDIVEDDVIIVIDNIGIGNNGYYSRTSAAGTNFADSFTTYTI